METKLSTVDLPDPQCPSRQSQAAVSVINVNKSYGRGKKVTPILNNFNMTVQRGTIYSLLGSSGCGKTTILSSIVGLKNVDSGKIFVHGFPPGTKDSGVPGKRVGYMPQEIALVGEFSIEETLRYFGSLYGMNASVLKRNSTFLIDFLKLPPKDRRINTLSGGQQRRVSFAVALIHNPELLILDEPTVGVDPLLRKSIWSHLLSLTSSGKTTVIITTHYIEEARESNTVGLMRNGHLLAENSPESLLQLHDTNLLEDVVLNLCLKNNSEVDEEENKYLMEENITFTLNRKQNIKDENGIGVVGIRYRRKNSESWDPESFKQWSEYQKISNANQDDISQQNKTSTLTAFFHRLKSLCTKNILQVTRNLIYLLFMMLLPAVTIFLVGAAIGGDVKDLKLGVVNKEANNFTSYSDYVSENFGCVLEENYNGSASVHYLSLINNSTFFSLVNYESEEEALQDVLRTKLYGYVTFPDNFTKFMKERILFGFNSELETALGSQFTLHLDRSKAHIGEEMKQKLYNWFFSLMQHWATMCNIENEKMQIPILFNKPVYGSEDTNFTEFIAPSVLLGLLFFFSLCGSGTSYIKDEKSGIHSRSQVAGVTKMEIMFSYFITNFVILLIQTALAFMCMTLAFDVKIQGSLVLAIAMAVVVGISGMSLGFLYTTFCSEEIQMVLLSIGTFLPNLFLNGMIWPTINMPIVLQYISIFLPCTLACETIRSIINRGLGFQHVRVWPGFLASVLWIVVYWSLTTFLSRKVFKK